MAAAPPHRAIGVIRVSERKGREGASFASPEDQRDRMRAACERDNLRLLDVFNEIDVSGGTPLDARRGLRSAVEAVEAGTADVVMVAYFDRLVRSLRVQDEVVSRVEAAGGRVLALDFGQVTNGTAAQWLSGTMVGAVSEYYRRSVRERSAEAQARAIARGVAPWPNIPPGYERRADGRLEPDPTTAPVVTEAFRIRAAGATIAEVRAFLADRGIKRSYHGTHAMLESRVYLGEIHFGSYESNPIAHPAIVEPDTWRGVQRVRVSRGRRAKSERLLARLGVLRCASCDGRMVVGTQTQRGRSYPFYRCGHVREDCDDRVTISAELVEGIVVDQVRRVLADAEGRASVEQKSRDDELALARAQGDLDAAIRAFAGLEDEQAARDRLAELRAVRDQAQERVEEHRLRGGSPPVLTINADDDWDRLSLDARRALIRAVVDRVLVVPGRGAHRVTVRMVGE